MSEPIKFSPEEMEVIQKIQQDYQNKIVELGRMELEKLAIEQRQSQLQNLNAKVKNEILDLQVKEKAFTDTMTAKYGQGKLNPFTGIFTPEVQVSE